MPRRRKKALPPLKLGADTIGQRLSRLRKERSLTQKDISEKVGIGQTIVSDYETGRLMPNGEMIARFAIALGVSADAILGLKRTVTEDTTPSVRVLKRLKRIANLPPPQRKTLLKTIDVMLKATEKPG